LTKEEATNLKKEFIIWCEKNGLFWDTHENGKPNLKDIVLTVSIRITDK